jgi:hypothetical protein
MDLLLYSLLKRGGGLVFAIYQMSFISRERKSMRRVISGGLWRERRSGHYTFSNNKRLHPFNLFKACFTPHKLNCFLEELVWPGFVEKCLRKEEAQVTGSTDRMGQA